MHRVNTALFLISLAIVLVSFWNRNDIPATIAFRPELEEEPSQKTARKRPFSVNYEGVTYDVEPQYRYDLYGMLVSYRHLGG